MNLLEHTLHLAGRLDKMGYPAIAGELDRIVENIIRTAKKHRKWEKIAGTSSGWRSQARAEFQEALADLLSPDLAKQAALGDAAKGAWNAAKGAWQGVTAPWKAENEQKQYQVYRQKVEAFVEETKTWDDQAYNLDMQLEKAYEANSEDQLTVVQQQGEALKGEISAAVEQFQQDANQALIAAREKLHPNYFFAQNNVAIAEEMAPKFSGEGYNNDVVRGGLQEMNNMIVQGHNEARTNYDKIVRDLSQKQNQWQNVENYSPFMQWVLMLGGEGRLRDMMGHSSANAQKIITNPKALRAVVQKYLNNKSLLDEIARPIGTDAEGLATQVQSNGFEVPGAGAAGAGA